MKYMRLLLCFLPLFPFSSMAQDQVVRFNVAYAEEVTCNANPASAVEVSVFSNMEEGKRLFVKWRIPDNVRVLKPGIRDIEMDDVSPKRSFSGALPTVSKEFSPEIEIYQEAGITFLVLELDLFFFGEGGRTLRVNAFSLFYSAEKDSRGFRNVKKKSVPWLASGTWIKISAPAEGVCFIPLSAISPYGMTDLARIHLLGSPLSILSEMNTPEEDNSLREIPVLRTDSGLYFFAKSPHRKKFSELNVFPDYLLNRFDRQVYYFLSQNEIPGLEISLDAVLPVSSENYQTSFFDAYSFYEPDTINILKSGSQWVSLPFDSQLNHSFEVDVTGWEGSSPVDLRTRVLARAGQSSLFSILNVTLSLLQIEVPPVYLDNVTTDYAAGAIGSVSFYPETEKTTLEIQYHKPDGHPSSVGWLDYLYLHFRKKLVLEQGSLLFHDRNSVYNQRITKFKIESDQAFLVWDVTNPVWPLVMSHTADSGNLHSFLCPTDSLRHFCAFLPAFCPQALIVGLVENQNVSSIKPSDLIILSPPEFVEQAERLALFHETEGVSAKVVSTDHIYNEFSSGSRDVSALRNFVRTVYRDGLDLGSPVKFLLLLGDGSYNNFWDVPGNNPWIPTFQSFSSLKRTDSYVSDDFFGLLDENEGGGTGLVDLGIGRIPVHSQEAARQMVDKIILYHQPEMQGDWRQALVFLADDEDGSLHLRQADSLAGYCSQVLKGFYSEKIFLDAYTQESTVSGQVYPLAHEMVRQRMMTGSLIFNYTGHGSEAGLTSEQVITSSDISGWENPGKTPLFVTATCEFSRFDDYHRLSAGEQVLLNPIGGGIGLLSTTRLAFSTPNFILNLNFFRTLQETTPGQEYLGSLIRKTKNRTGVGSNQRNFTLLGDPALRLAFPRLRVAIDSLTGADTSGILQPLTRISFFGRILDTIGIFQSGYSGKIQSLVLGKQIIRETLANDGEATATFRDYGPVLFRGTSTVANGAFEVTFLVPRGAGGVVGPGQLFFYGIGAEGTDAVGNETIRFGGNEPAIIQDQVGPDIRIFLNETEVPSEEVVGNQPRLTVSLSDSSGINLGGMAIGRDIVGVLDGDASHPILLSPAFRYDENSFMQGKTHYLFPKLQDGWHALSIKAWDNCDNPSEKTLTFLVQEFGELQLDRLFTYPNPFIRSTGFYFTHNQPGLELTIQIQVLGPAGRLVRNLEFSETGSGSLAGPFLWDGLDDFGQQTGRGVYFYLLKIKTPDGKCIRRFEKLVKLG